MPLPEELISEIEDIRPYVREAAVQKLEKIVKGRNIGLARSAMQALEKIVADDNTTRRVAQAALQILESVKQAQDSANQKVEEEQRIREGAERLAGFETGEKQLERERAEAKRKANQEIAKREATHLRVERERAEKTLQEKEKKKAAENKAARLKREREAAMQASREKVEYQFEQIKAKLHQSSEIGEAKWRTFVTFFKTVPVSRYRIHIALGMTLPLIAAISFWEYQKLNSLLLVFSSTAVGGINVHFYNDNTTGQLTSSVGNVSNWSPTVSASGKLYFTSDRTGKAEIYCMKNDGEALGSVKIIV